MKWDFWISQYLDVHCTARGLASKSICAYRDTLKGFKGYVEFQKGSAQRISRSEQASDSTQEFLSCNSGLGTYGTA
jgi:site-specific recombinase XerD